MGHAVGALLLCLVLLAPGVLQRIYIPLAIIPPERMRLVVLVNDERKRQGLEPLTEHPGLSTAAQEHAEAMRDGAPFQHDSADGTLWWLRIERHYTPWLRMGEVIAAGQSNGAAAVEAWLNSPGHRAALLSPDYEHLGVGYARGGTWGRYWVIDLGAQP